jgi:putative endonuclease
MKSGALYCGVSNNVVRRFAQHQAGTGAKALRGKGPLELVWQYDNLNKSESMQWEFKIKRFSKSKKEKLISGEIGLLE